MARNKWVISDTLYWLLHCAWMTKGKYAVDGNVLEDRGPCTRMMVRMTLAALASKWVGH
jgi:hypothetical protein